MNGIAHAVQAKRNPTNEPRNYEAKPSNKQPDANHPRQRRRVVGAIRHNIFLAFGAEVQARMRP